MERLFDNPGVLSDKLSREMTHQPFVDPTKGIKDWWSGLNTLQKVGMSPVGFPVNDIAGLAGDLQMFKESPETRSPLNYALSGLGLLPFIPGMTAFHGTPHKFPPTKDNPLGEFDLSKIGTGEGAQAYGHGIYLAESPGVAGSYQAALAPNTATITSPSGKEFQFRRTAPDIANDNPAVDFSTDELQRIKEISRELGVDETEASISISRLLDNEGSEALGMVAKPDKGLLYEVDLPDEHIAKMLDWDKPLSEQDAGKKLASMLDIVKETEPSDSNWLLTFNGRIINGFNTRKAAKEFIDNAKGGDVVNLLNSPTLGAQNRRIVSQQLNEAGIPGIKYLDAASRTAKEGTRNFVLFDPSIAKITGKK